MAALIGPRRVLLGVLIAGTLLPAHGALAGQSNLTRVEIQQIFPDLSSGQAFDSRYGGLITRVAQHLDLDPALIDAVIAHESNYQTGAISTAGAIGLMQLMPGGGAIDAYERLYGRAGKPTRASLERADVNIWLGSAYLRLLKDRYYADFLPGARIPLILAAYNWGIGHMQRKPPERRLIKTRAQALAWINNTCPAETRRYVREVLSKYDDRRHLLHVQGPKLASNLRSRVE